MGGIPDGEDGDPIERPAPPAIREMSCRVVSVKESPALT